MSQEIITPRVQIMGVPVDTMTTSNLLEQIGYILNQNEQHQIVTVNPEMILLAQHDGEFKQILNNSWVNTADGTGLLWAANCKNNNTIVSLLKLTKLLFIKPNFPISERIKGSDLVYDIAELASRKNKSIFLLGAAEGIAEKAKFELLKKYPHLKIVGTYSGTPSIHEQEKIKDLINDVEPDILLVAYGAPSQEKWIARMLKKIPSVKLAIGVGGTFDYISGTIPRAPLLMQNLGLEWLYRLLQEPKKRLPRIINAVITFPKEYLQR